MRPARPRNSSFARAGRSHRASPTVFVTDDGRTNWRAAASDRTIGAGSE